MEIRSNWDSGRSDDYLKFGFRFSPDAIDKTCPDHINFMLGPWQFMITLKNVTYNYTLSDSTVGHN